jgi:hypothetical protein
LNRITDQNRAPNHTAEHKNSKNASMLQAGFKATTPGFQQQKIIHTSDSILSCPQPDTVTRERAVFFMSLSKVKYYHIRDHHPPEI